MSESGMYNYRQIGKVECATPNQPDTLFLTSTSFEQRSTFTSEKLSSEYKAEYFVVIRYRQSEYAGISEQTDLNLNRIYSTFLERAKTCSGKVEVIECDREDPLDGYLAVEEILEQIETRTERPVVTMDISTLTKQYILLFLKAIYDKKISLRVLYTSAQNYQRQLTWGVKSIVSVPFYNGHQLSRNGTILVIFLGYERDRASAIWKSCDPLKTIAVVCKGTTNAHSQTTIPERLNKYMLEVSEAEVKTIDRFNINETIALLEELSKQYPEDKHNLVVSPLSTKVQALGLGLFFQETMNKTGHSPFSVQYSIPFDYAKEYSLGTLALWQYDLIR